MSNTRTPPSDQVELNDLGSALSKRKLFDSGDFSNFTGSSNRSMDLCLKSEDLMVDAGRIKSSDFIRDEILKSDAPQQRPAGKLPPLKLAKELYRNSSRDWANDFGQPTKAADPSVFSSHDMHMPPLPFDRIGSGEFRLSSRDFFKIPSIDLGLGPLDRSLYVNCPSPADVAAQIMGSTVTPPPPLPPLDAPPSDHYQHYEEYEVPIHGAPMDVSESSDPKPTKPKRKRGRKPRELDLSRHLEPNKNDVKLGRGGANNVHPGNLRFRAKALELRPWYEASTKEQKFHIANVLVEFIKADGYRFVEMGKDKLWHEVICKTGPHTKASQTLRERLEKDKKKSK